MTRRVAVLESLHEFMPSVIESERTGETTHLSVIDKNGIAVSLTQSIERVYNSKAAADGLRFQGVAEIRRDGTAGSL